jgi:hypothetical protein
MLSGPEQSINVGTSPKKFRLFGVDGQGSPGYYANNSGGIVGRKPVILVPGTPESEGELSFNLNSAMNNSITEKTTPTTRAGSSQPTEAPTQPSAPKKVGVGWWNAIKKTMEPVNHWMMEVSDSVINNPPMRKVAPSVAPQPQQGNQPNKGK